MMHAQSPASQSQSNRDNGVNRQASLKAVAAAAANDDDDEQHRFRKRNATTRLKEWTDCVKRFAVPVALFLFLILVLLWDMKRVQTISTVIHDDHADLWQEMNEVQLHQWYAPMDLCLLSLKPTNTGNTSSGEKHAKVHRNCSQLPPDSSLSVSPNSNRPLCGIGWALGKRCSLPLSNHSFFTSRLKDHVLGDAYAGTLRQAMHRLADHDVPVIFIGDMISKQNQEALLCEMKRTDVIEAYGVLYGNSYYNSNPSVSSASGQEGTDTAAIVDTIVPNFTIAWKHSNMKGKKVTVYFYHMPFASEKSSPVISTPRVDRNRHRSKDEGARTAWNASSNSSNISDNHRIRKRTVLSVAETIGLAGANNHRERNSNSNSNSNSNTNTSSGSDGGVASKSYLKLDELKASLGNLTMLHPKTLIVANMGIWYNSRDHFRKDIHLFLSWLNDLGKEGHMVLYRETTAQHWNHSINGYYSMEMGDSMSGSCTPIEDSSPQYDWRNWDARQYIENEDINNITWVPLRDITAPMFDMHPYSNERKDCTSFCYFPMMWQSVWHAFDTITSSMSKKHGP